MRGFTMNMQIAVVENIKQKVFLQDGYRVVPTNIGILIIKGGTICFALEEDKIPTRAELAQVFLENMEAQQMDPHIKLDITMELQTIVRRAKALEVENYSIPVHTK